jgi:polysaccharide biosynthesis/export protein
MDRRHFCRDPAAVEPDPVNRLAAALPLLLAAAVLLLSACGMLPAAGPSAGTLQDSKQVSIVNVTPEQAQALAASDAQARSSAEQDALNRLIQAPDGSSFVFSPGDSFHVTVFTIAPTLSNAGVPSTVDLGAYTVSNEGSVELPYIGSMAMAGLSLKAAQAQIASRLAARGILQAPSVKIDVSASPRNSILVTGALGAPRLVAWNPGGVTLADAITQALGNGLDIMGSDDTGPSDRSAIDVAVFRHDGPAVKIPMQTALEHRIELAPGDRIVVTKKPAVRIIVLGGGVNKDGNYEYARDPSLAAVLAQASGLDTNVANNRAVFVLEPHGQGAPPVLYDFAWDRAAGLIASQVFPLRDGDLVYVDEAPIAPVQKVLNTLLPVAATAQLVR